MKSSSCHEASDPISTCRGLGFCAVPVPGAGVAELGFHAEARVQFVLGVELLTCRAWSRELVQAQSSSALSSCSRLRLFGGHKKSKVLPLLAACV